MRVIVTAQRRMSSVVVTHAPDPRTAAGSGPANGWVHVLENSELAFLMMIAQASSDAYQQVKISGNARILHYGLGRDAYEAHMTLSRFGLVDVEIDENRHDDGKVANSGKGGEARLHAFRPLPGGFEEPAASTIKQALQ